MAYSFAEISATEQALRDADKPMLLGQAIPVIPIFAGWNTTGYVASGDSSETGYPPSRAFDGLTHLTTRPTGTASTWFFVMQFPAPGIEFDWFGSIGENSKLFTSPTSFQLQVSDADFSANIKTIVLPTPPGTDARLQEDVLRHIGAPGTDGIRYSNVEYARLAFVNSGNFIPEISEIVLGRRRQLAHKPRTPYDPNTLDGDHSDLVTASGVRHRYTFNDGRHRLEANLNPASEPFLSDIPAWFRTGKRFGRSPFVWVEDPGTYPERWHWMMMDQPELYFPVQDFVERTFSLNAHEQGPERFYLERE